MQKCRATEAGQTFENDLNFVRHSDSASDDSRGDSRHDSGDDGRDDSRHESRDDSSEYSRYNSRSAVVKVRIVVRIKGMIVEPIVLRQYSSKVFSRQSKK